MAAAPAESTCSHSGIFTGGPARLTTAITSGARTRRSRSASTCSCLASGYLTRNAAAIASPAERLDSPSNTMKRQVLACRDRAPVRRQSGVCRFRWRMGEGRRVRPPSGEEFKGVGHDRGDGDRRPCSFQSPEKMRVIAVATPQDKPGASTIPFPVDRPAGFPGDVTTHRARYLPGRGPCLAANAALTARNFHAHLQETVQWRPVAEIGLSPDLPWGSC
jgi:hypothetical protein